MNNIAILQQLLDPEEPIFEPQRVGSEDVFSASAEIGDSDNEPYNPELSKSPVKVLDISSSQVKRRVVAIAKQDYGKLKYKDESIFYLEDESEPDKPTASEHKWLTQ
ncbi:unnamed protein product [Phytophthora lilii]|uniref:Unnamed protein product n=1 Tax=Phytophthora lilii TaxID=2077276 RepID=A0A9W6TF76_9STRA|nr:unnamed protein product [Phytophthora lilii]